MKNYKGFSLMELMVVVAIIGIIAMFALPSYQNSQRKARIAQGVAALVEARSEIEKYRLANRKKYKDIVSEGFTKIGIEPNVKYSKKVIYIITLKLATVAGNDDAYDSTEKYTLTATADGTWLDTKDKCRELKLNGFGILTPAECQN